MYYCMLIPGAGPGPSSFSRVSSCAHIAQPYSRQIISGETQKTGNPIFLACNDVQVTTMETLKFLSRVEERARASCDSTTKANLNSCIIFVVFSVNTLNGRP